jgi:hypothetical protein
MLSHEVTITTSRALRAAIAAVLVALMVNGCGFTGPDPAACKAALQAEYVKATAGQGHFNANPPACKGLQKAQVQQLVQQVLDGK